MDEAVIGRTGTVVVRVRGDAGPGEVTVSVRGGTETFLAYASSPLDVGAAVLVTGSRGTRAVTVEPWS